MRYRDNLATIGMAVVLLLFLAVSRGGVLATQRATSRVTRAEEFNNVLQTAQRLANAESALRQDYYLRPSEETRLRFESVEAAALAGLRVANSAADPADYAGLARSLVVQGKLHTATNLFFAAVDKGNRAAALAIKDHTIAPLVAANENEIATGLRLLTQRLSSSVSSLNATEDTVRNITIAVAVTGLALLLIFWRLLRSYRRQLKAAFQAEVAHLQASAMTDYLTGLGNNRAFVVEEARALAVAQRTGEGLALALIDVDAFKQINDQHGHSHGDHVLAALGALLRGGRAGDRAFRIGGDEFALLMQPAHEPGASTALERLRLAAEQQLFGATISIGVAVLEPEVDDMATLREKADAALYEVKRRGRNATVSFAEIQEHPRSSG
jgi:diguanylate cyclase (GGDEF)-like protein